MEVGDDLDIGVTFSALLGVKGTQRDPDAFLVQVQCVSGTWFRGEKNLPCSGLEIMVIFTV